MLDTACLKAFKSYKGKISRMLCSFSSLLFPLWAFRTIQSNSKKMKEGHERIRRSKVFLWEPASKLFFYGYIPPAGATAPHSFPFCNIALINLMYALTAPSTSTHSHPLAAECQHNTESPYWVPLVHGNGGCRDGECHFITLFPSTQICPLNLHVFPFPVRQYITPSLLPAGVALPCVSTV